MRQSALLKLDEQSRIWQISLSLSLSLPSLSLMCNLTCLHYFTLLAAHCEFSVFRLARHVLALAASRK